MMRNTTRCFVSLASLATAFSMVFALSGCPAEENDKAKTPPTSPAPVAETAKPEGKVAEATPVAATGAPAAPTEAAKPDAPAAPTPAPEAAKK